MFIAFWTFFALGCAPAEKIGSVKGSVSYQGKPLTVGSVVFENAQTGEAVMAALQGDGSYVALTFNRPGLPVGTYKVAISPNEISTGEFVPVEPPTEGSAPPPRPVAPTKYHTTATSGLTVEVREGDNPPFNFELVD